MLAFIAWPCGGQALPFCVAPFGGNLLHVGHPSQVGSHTPGGVAAQIIWNSLMEICLLSPSYLFSYVSYFSMNSWILILYFGL